MKLLLFVALAILAVTDVFAAEEEKEFVRPKYEWVVSEGKPCAVVFEPQGILMRKTYYFNEKGEMKALLREELDSPGSTRPLVARYLFAFDKSYQVIGMKRTFYNYGDGGKVVENEAIHNNYACLKEERVHYRDGGLNSVSPTKKDGKGNWLAGDDYTSAPKVYPISRKIYYYGEHSKFEAKTKEILAEADSLVRYCEAERWSAAHKNTMERKSSHGLWWNVLLPALISALFSFLFFKIFCLNRKVSNLMIMIVSALTIYVVGNYLVIPLGPYGGLWTFLYWLIAFIVGGFLLSSLMVLRCPRCAAYGGAKRIARKYETKTDTETAVYSDGHKEVLNRSVERTTIDTYRCNECGCTWKHHIFGVHSKNG